MNHTIFISDLHLHESATKKTTAFLKFLATTAAQAEALYILGDLFEVWIGDDDNSPFTKKIKAALKATAIPIYLMHGNRDFLIGEKFAQETGCQLIEDPTKINLYGIPTLLTHGDLLCSKDTSYIKYRKLAHNPKCHKLFLLLPFKLRKYIANYLRNKSIKAQTLKSTAEKDAVTTTVIKLMRGYQVTQLIHGHTHRPAITDIETGKLISLPSWNDAPTYIYADAAGQLNLVP
jgi:UDP-2,3-diacylglucosamine hydrolase